MAYEVRYTLRAAADRESIFQYLNVRSPKGASHVMAAIVAASNQLRVSPKAGIATTFPNIRVIRARRFPYNIYYRIHDGIVELIHIRHTSRRPWPPQS
jgi:plasmid stabilization system protein ParE